MAPLRQRTITLQIATCVYTPRRRRPDAGFVKPTEGSSVVRSTWPATLRLGILLIAIALVTGACGGDDEAETTTTATAVPRPPTTTTTRAPTSTSSATTTTSTMAPEPVGGPSLLNGLPTEVDADADRRVVAVKIDNHPDARPQSGIQEADAVIELVVESGITRFIALFHTSDSEYVGPIRSGRPTDPTLVRPLEAVMQISGAQGWVQSIIRNAGVSFLSETEPNTFRIPRGTRAYERTLYGTTEEMRNVADGRDIADDAPSGPWFEFAEDPTATTEDAEVALFNWSPQWPTVRWEWDGEQWIRFNGETAHEWVDAEGEGEQISADVLIVLMADQYTASGSSGSSVPALTTLGEGAALVFHSGGVLEGTWERESIEEYFVLKTPDGDTITVPPGRLWLAMFPDHRTVEWE